MQVLGAVGQAGGFNNMLGTRKIIMNNPLDRKMFRQAGMSKQPMGILASSPELMGAVKGYQQGGLNAIPILGSKKFNVARSVQPNAMNTLGSPFQDNIGVQIQNETPLEVLKKEQEIRNKNIEPNVVKNSNINNINKNILDSENLEYPKGSNLNVRGKTNKFEGEEKETSDTETTKSDVSADTLYGGVSKNIEDEAKLIKVAYDKFNKNTADLKDAEFLGTTYNKEVAKQLELLQKEGKEFSIADAKKVAKGMGFSDPEELDKQYGEDREASFWLNMMKAGAAMAAGGSSNTLTNFAKGFTVGLEGYGKDTGELRKELRADKKEASKTIYNLLKDGRSEELAKRALDLQKSAAITNILKTEVGEERARLTNEVNNEVANRKLTISLYKTFADMNFEAKKFNVSRDDFNQSIQMAYAKMMPDDLKILQAAGQITVIDPSKPLTPDNLKATPEGQKNIANILTKNFNGKITDTQVAITTAGSLGTTDSGIGFNKEAEGYNAKEIGTAIKEYNKRRSDQIKSLGTETPMIANQDIQFASVYGGKINFGQQTDRMKELFKAPGPNNTRSLFEKNKTLFINFD